MTLEEKVIAYNREIKEALQTIYDALNPGQKKQIVKNDAVKALFTRYRVETTDANKQEAK